MRRIRYRWRKQKQEKLKKKIYSRICGMKNNEEEGTIIKR